MGRISLADPQSLSWEECGTGSKKSCWREHCELICLSEVAKSLEAEEQAGYHQRAAYLCSFACLSFSSCFRAQSPCQCTNDNALFFFFLMITWSCCLKWRQDIWISEVALYFLSRTEVLNTQDVTACIQKKPLFWECFSVFCYPNSPLG